MEKLYSVANKLEETSNGLLNDIRSRSSLNRMYEKQSLALKKKLVEERKKAYDAASRKQGEGKGGLGILRDLFLLRFLRGRGRGGGGFGRGGGRPPVGPRGGLGISPRITPRNNIVPFSRGRVPTRLGGLSRVGPLAVLGTGLDFTSRLGSGQNILQASLGSGGGLAGALAGGAKGAALGSVAGPIGTLIGGIGGSILGGIAGGSIADFLSGANRRRGQELERVTMMSRETEFSRASDDFDVVLDKFEGNTAPMLKSMKGEAGEEGKMNMNIPGVTAPKTGGGGFWKTVGGILKFIAKEALIAFLLTIIPIPGSRFALVARLANMFRRFKALNKIVKFTRPAIKVTKKYAHKLIPKSSISGRIIQRNNKIIARRRLEQRSWFKKSNASRGLDINETFIFPTRRPLNINPNTIRRTPQMQRNVEAGESVLKGIKTNKNPWDIITKPRPRKKFRQLEIPDLIKNAESDPKSSFLRSLVERETGTYIRPFTPDPIRPFKGSSITAPTGQVSEPLKKIIDQVKIDKPNLFSRQEGGRVEAGRPYIVGEIGKELFVPDASGEIVPNEDLPSSNLLVIDREPERIIIPQVVQGESDIVPMSSAPNPYDVVAKYAQMTGLFTV